MGGGLGLGQEGSLLNTGACIASLLGDLFFVSTCQLLVGGCSSSCIESNLYAYSE